jgi:hypothetical protein
MSYDSTQDTLDHIQSVRDKIELFVVSLRLRGANHDQSKLASPEKELFDEMTPILATITYGSDEYKASLAKLRPALEHHYANNTHHPEHFKRGIDEMNLLDVVEMFCDWMAATERHKTGDMRKSLEVNEKRFNMSPQLANIFHNTLKIYGL